MTAMTDEVRRLVRRGLPFLIGMVVSCSGPSDVELITVMLYGHVSDAAGTPMPNIAVSAYPFPFTNVCADTGSEHPAHTKTDVHGAYRMGFGFSATHLTGCIQVIAFAPNPAYVPDTVRQDGIIFRLASPPDSVRVDLVLQPAP